VAARHTLAEVLLDMLDMLHAVTFAADREHIETAIELLIDTTEKLRLIRHPERS